MRELASIKEISNISQIDGRDRIELAQIDGWSVIVKKDEFRIGDLCVYVEIDSVLPERPEFEFLRSKNFRIKTMKMAGVLSQGICFPLDILPKREAPYVLGEDVTAVLGVRQYVGTMDVDPVPKEDEKPKRRWPGFLMRFRWFRNLVAPKKSNGGFPSFISKTDETRIQNIPYIVADKRHWVATEKIDGTSGTFALVRHRRHLFLKDRFEYIVCSRNLRLGAKDNSIYWKVSEMYGIENALRNMIGERDWVAIQGECVGPGVQKNKYGLAYPDLYVFNLVYPSGRLGSVVARSIVENHGMKFVPIVDDDCVLPDTVDEVLRYATGKSALADTMREGLVFRSKDGKISFKAVSNEFLLKWDE